MAAVLAVGLVLAAPGLAQAARSPALTPLEAPSWRLATDSRYAAWETGRGRVHVVDTRTGAERDIKGPGDCDYFQDIGGGLALWTCTGTNRYLESALTELETGAVHEVDASSTGGVLHDAGRNWLSGVIEGYHYTLPFYFNWHTGIQDRPDNVLSPLASPRVVPDLDRASLVRPLCKPLRRRRIRRDPYDTEVYGERFETLQYERPYAVQPGRHGFDLLRCGTRKRRRIRGAGSVTLRGGLLTWRAGRTLRARVLRSGRTYAWRLSALDPLASTGRITQTDTTIFISTMRDTPGDGRFFSYRWRR